jgi:hypothetical protein
MTNIQVNRTLIPNQKLAKNRGPVTVSRRVLLSQSSSTPTLGLVHETRHILYLHLPNISVAPHLLAARCRSAREFDSSSTSLLPATTSGLMHSHSDSECDNMYFPYVRPGGIGVPDLHPFNLPHNSRPRRKFLSNENDNTLTFNIAQHLMRWEGHSLQNNI